MMSVRQRTIKKKKERKHGPNPKDTPNKSHNIVSIHRKVILSFAVLLVAWYWIPIFFSDNRSERAAGPFINRLKEGNPHANLEKNYIKPVTTKSKDELIAGFLDWFLKNGGYISPNVALKEFEDFGGYGLVAISNPSSGNKNPSSDETVLKKFDELYRIPPTIITSAKSVYSLYHKGTRPVLNFQSRMNQALQNYFSSSLVQQDVIIAMHLMVECSLRDQSDLRPYLDVLPQEIIPRLDTFSVEELSLLNDPALSKLAEESKQSLKKGWYEGNLEGLVLEMSKSTQAQKQAVTVIDDLCLNFDSFHKYISFVSSRAMVLRGTKYLAPLADFMNYAARNDNRSSQESLTFDLYHNRNEMTGFISVRADRSVQTGQQIFEDYGDVDNSLFLEAHGFVPDENPFHCAEIRPEYLPSLKDIRNDIFQVLKTLKLMYVSEDGNINIPDICVKMDGTLSTKWAEELLKIVFLSDHFPEQRKLCVDAIERNDIEFAKFQCTKFRGHEHALSYMLENSSRKALCNQDDSLENDLMTVAATLSQRNDIKNELESDDTRKLLALKFRISDKKILSHIGNFKEHNICNHPDLVHNDVRSLEQISAEPCSFDPLVKSFEDSNIDNEALIRFNEFLSNLDIPLKKIEPYFFGDRMRIGAIVTEDVKLGDPYISIGNGSVISVDTAFVKSYGNEHPVNKILRRFRSNPKDGGFHALLFFLLHETFIMREDSFWFPYISLLPTVEDLKVSVPLFLDEDKLELLAVSDVRSSILRYQQKVANEFHSFSTDISLVDSFGANVMFDFDKFKWAYSIIDTRSIWWEGKRHLVPLLDLVNCNELYNENDRSPNRVHETFQHPTMNIATTKASHTVSRGNQIFENYGQPNHIYFLYHGFTLKENSHNCVMLNESIDRGDPGAFNVSNTKERLLLNGFDGSFTRTFCISDKVSLNEIANFLRIKQGISSGDNTGLQNDVLQIVIDLISVRLDRHRDIAFIESCGRNLSNIEKHMVDLVGQEKEILSKLMSEIKSL